MACDKLKQFEDWFKKEVEPQVIEFYAHMNNCQECREFLLSQKDSYAEENGCDDEYHSQKFIFPKYQSHQER